MARKRKKKPLMFRLASLLLFLSITWLVFNFPTLIHKTTVLIGLKDLNLEEVESIDIEFNEDLNGRPYILAHNNHVIVAGSHELSIYDHKGTLISKKKINSNNSEVIGLSKYIAVVDKTQGLLSFLDYQGNPVGSSNSIGPIKEAIGVDKDKLAVITQARELLIYDYQGRAISNLPIDDGEIIGLNLSVDKSQVMVSLLGFNESTYISTLGTYPIDGYNMVGAWVQQGRILYGVELVNDLIIMVDDIGRRVLTTSSQTVVWQEDRTGALEHFKIDNNGNIYEIVAVAGADEMMGQSHYELHGYNLDGLEIFSHSLDFKYDKISLKNGQIMLQSTNGIMILDSSGDLLLSFDSGKRIIDSQWLSKEDILIEFDNYFKIYNMKY